MLVDPPIDKLEKMADCKYMLVCGVAKRARELLQQSPDLEYERNEKAISIAAREVFSGKVVIVKE